MQKVKSARNRCDGENAELSDHILEEPKYEIKGLQYYLNGSKPQYKTFEYNSVGDVDY